MTSAAIVGIVIAVMSTAAADQHGVVSGLLNLSRDLGLIAGACAMGAVFACATATPASALLHLQMWLARCV